jgi:hypothetical protein
MNPWSRRPEDGAVQNTAQAIGNDNVMAGGANPLGSYDSTHKTLKSIPTSREAAAVAVTHHRLQLCTRTFEGENDRQAIHWIT